MPAFGTRSKEALATAHPDLQRLFNEVIKHWDCAVLEGHRDKASQDAAVAAGNSKLKWPKSKHNSLPARAVDVVPWPLDWKNADRFVLFAGFVLGVASQLGIKIRWGGDWDNNRNPRDERFRDLPHFELV